jgi:hypothetical protein
MLAVRILWVAESMAAKQAHVQQLSAEVLFFQQTQPQLSFAVCCVHRTALRSVSSWGAEFAGIAVCALHRAAAQAQSKSVAHHMVNVFHPLSCLSLQGGAFCDAGPRP